MSSGMAADFSVVEGDFLRSKFLPDFEWARFDRPTESVALARPIEQARVALVVTAGAYLPACQEPFNTKTFLGDDSFRVIPGDARREDIGLCHPGYDTRRAAQDLDCVFPLALLRELQGEGAIGEVAPRHVSFMGYIPRTEHLITETAPEAARILADDGVDLAILVPS
ncbi:MAG TPA: glycine/sarcosine/betaine reductase selenoprotein B family protein [Thermoleophilia bacterium]|nr:glycine/sarcosine/betaine reductase selenoprotein B family protein [Thermoleophilia bacterium]